jgi:hypothetical protein
MISSNMLNQITTAIAPVVRNAGLFLLAMALVAAGFYALVN